MKLSDISNGSDWVIWVIVIIMAILSVVFISGHGSMLIAGYNTASDEEKAEYDVKKLCRILGLGFAVITVVIFIMGLLLFIACDINVALNNVQIFEGIDYHIVNYLMRVFYLPSQVMLSLTNMFVKNSNLVLI